MKDVLEFITGSAKGSPAFEFAASALGLMFDLQSGTDTSEATIDDLKKATDEAFKKLTKDFNSRIQVF